MKKHYVFLTCVTMLFVCAHTQAAMSIDGNASDWSGILVNLDAQDRTYALDVMGWGAVVEGDTAYFAQTLKYSMWDYFNYNQTGMVWMNAWINLDNDIASGFEGWQMENLGWEDDGIDIGVEVGARDYSGDPWTISLYYTCGDDDNYQDCSGSFAFSADGKFLEWSAPVSELISAAVANLAVDDRGYGTINQTLAADSSNWQVGMRIDGSDSVLGVYYAHQASEIEGHEGLVNLPIVPGDADLDHDVDLDDLGALADNWGTTTGGTTLMGDFDCDGDVDLDDLGKLADNWGTTASGDPVNTAPEPATMILLGFGGLTLLKRKCRSR